MMRTLLSALLALVRAALIPRATLALENAALRQQLTICLRTQKRTRLRAEELAARFGIQHSPSTVRRYMVPRTPRGDQTWRTFACNHGKELWACDVLTQYTALFAIAYVFVIRAKRQEAQLRLSPLLLQWWAAIAGHPWDSRSLPGTPTTSAADR